MIIKILLLLFCIVLVFTPLSVSAQKLECSEVRDHCISVAEKEYNECSENCSDPEVHEATVIPACIALGYKPSSLKYQECIEEEIKSCKQGCKQDYHENTEFCHECYKKCRKGDVFGTVQMFFVVNDDDINSGQHLERKGSFTVTGLWKFQPAESTKGKKGLRTFSEAYTKVIYNYYERATTNRCTTNPACTLRWYLHHSSAPMPFCPECGPSKIYIADIPNMGSIYTVAYRGMVAILRGKQMVNCRYCQYKDYSRQINVGEFFISDDVKTNGEMSGSDSWKSCGDAFQDNVHCNAFQDNVHFTINRNKQVSKLGKVQYSPKKREGYPAGNSDVSIQANWKFYLAK